MIYDSCALFSHLIFNAFNAIVTPFIVGFVDGPTVACIETRGLGNLPYKPGISN